MSRAARRPGRRTTTAAASARRSTAPTAKRPASATALASRSIAADPRGGESLRGQPGRQRCCCHTDKVTQQVTRLIRAMLGWSTWSAEQREDPLPGLARDRHRGLRGAVRARRARGRAVLPDLRRPRRRAAAARDGARRPDDLVGPEPCAGCWPSAASSSSATTTATPAGPPRWPGRVTQRPCWCGRSRAGGADAVHDARTWPTTRFAPPRPPRPRIGPPRRGLDGRDDRADDGDRAPAAGAVADVDHVDARASARSAGSTRACCRC